MDSSIQKSSPLSAQGAQSSLLETSPDDLELSDRQLQALDYLARGQLIQSVRHNMRIETQEWQQWMAQPAWHSFYVSARTLQWYAGARVAKAMLHRNAGMAARTVIDTARAGDTFDVRLRAALALLDRVGLHAPKSEINVDNRQITFSQLTPEQQERYIKALEMLVGAKSPPK